jgi:hypothetical protein
MTLAQLVVAHGGTTGAIVEASIAVGLVVLGLAAWIGSRRDGD